MQREGGESPFFAFRVRSGSGAGAPGAALVPLPDEVVAPGQAGQQVAGWGQHAGQGDQAEEQGASQVGCPGHQGSEPGRQAGAAHLRRGRELSGPGPEYPLADRERQQVDGDDGEGVGVQGGEQGQGQVDPQGQAADCRRGHLEGAGDQSAEQAGGDGARC